MLSSSARALQRCNSTLKTWRDLHVRVSTIREAFQLEKEVTHLSLGVGFLAAYTPNTSAKVWVKPFDCQSDLFGELGRWHCLRIPTEGSVVRQVACGRSHMVALTTDGEVYTSGLNAFGQCGQTSQLEIEQDSLHCVPGLADRIHQVACGLDHTLFLTSSGQVLSCGWSADGQTGTGGYSNVLSPVPVQLPPKLHVSNLYTSADTSFAMAGDGNVYGWGNNEYGQVGVASDGEQLGEPVALNLSALDGRIISMATGGAFTAFLTDKGSVYLVGYSIDDPSLSHKQADTSNKLLPPQQMSKARKIHDGRTSGDSVCDIHAGLHYLIGQVSSHEVIVWGRYPDSSDLNAAVPYRKITLEPPVQSMSYGPSSIATLFR